MQYLPSILSLMRFPLAFFFLQTTIFYRVLAIFLAGVTDGLDGYVARKWNVRSQFGAVIDPIMDKFFVLFILIVLINEGQLSTVQALTMLSRDVAVGVFGGYLLFSGALATYEFRAIWCGKITTSLQLAVILALTCQIPILEYVYVVFVLLGLGSLIELSVRKH
ncbi:MAG: CDP-alcohol phosphatidyltransferase family protein [Parachlamydiaceae bacterium]|nr:CDP-alcohol phosphatidyltransferase family protein [Parachlamydiaceae bacterium]